MSGYQDNNPSISHQSYMLYCDIIHYATLELLMSSSILK